MNLESILNYIKVTERIASSGQPNTDQFNLIAAAGYDVIINLAMPESNRALAAEGAIVAAHEIVYVHIPVPFDAPTPALLKQFLHVMAAFSQNQVWVHCVVNYRVSAFLYQYLRLTQGASIETARRALLPSWQPDPLWTAFMALNYDDIYGAQ